MQWWTEPAYGRSPDKTATSMAAQAALYLTFSRPCPAPKSRQLLQSRLRLKPANNFLDEHIVGDAHHMTFFILNERK